MQNHVVLFPDIDIYIYIDTLYTQFISGFLLPSNMPLLNHRIEQAFLHSLGGPVESKGSPIPLDLHHHRPKQKS